MNVITATPMTRTNGPQPEQTTSNWLLENLNRTRQGLVLHWGANPKAQPDLGKRIVKLYRATHYPTCKLTARVG